MEQTYECKTCKQQFKKEQKLKQKTEEEDQEQKDIAEAIIHVKLEPSKSSHMDSKYIVKIGHKTIGFGTKGFSDFTHHKSESRKQDYIARHAKRQEQYWLYDSKNIYTASFWERYLLNECDDIYKAIELLETQMKIKLKYTKNTIDKQHRKISKTIKLSKEDVDE